MSSPARKHPQNRRLAALPWPDLARRNWPTLWRLTFMALVATLSLVLAGPTASAAPTPPPAAESPSGKPTFTGWLNWKMHEVLSKDTLDPHDKKFLRKSIAQIGTQRVLTQMKQGTLPGLKDLLFAAIEDGREFSQRKQQTLEGRKKRVTDAQDEIVTAKENLSAAKTPQQQKRAEETLRKARAHYKKVSAELRATKETQPKEIPAQIKDLDKKIRKLENKTGDLERKKGKLSLPGGRKLVQQKIDAGRQKLDEAEQERKHLKDRRDNGDDTDGTRPAKPGPKAPTQGPGSTSTKPPTLSDTTRSPKLPITGTEITPKAPTTTGKKLPQPFPDRPAMKVPRVGNVRGGGLSQTVGDLFGQAYAQEMAKEHEKVFDKALADPELRKRLIDEHKQYEENNPIENLRRPFTGPEFTPGELYENGPKLIEVQKTQDMAEARAKKSNADPLYQKARTDCGGYDTCVTERTKKLREKNTKDIAKSTANAKKSNADPLYQKARTDCGGYDTCVTERTRKLRDQAKEQRTTKPVADEADQKQKSDDRKEAKRTPNTSDSGKKATASKNPGNPDGAPNSTKRSTSKFENQAV